MSDPTIRFVLDYCMKYSQVKRAWLFGSRSKGSAVETSDYDLAFEWEADNEQKWGEFSTELREFNPRLNTLDIVRMDQVGAELRERVLGEGKLIYEQN